MRNKRNNTRISMVLAVAAGILAMTAATPALALSDPLTVKNVSVSGAVVEVTVKNVTMATVASSIAVEAEVNGSSSFSIVPVTLLPGQTATVSAAFAGTVTNVNSVGISLGVINDEGTPF